MGSTKKPGQTQGLPLRFLDHLAGEGCEGFDLVFLGVIGAPIDFEQLVWGEAADSLVFRDAHPPGDLRALDQVELEAAGSVLAQGGVIDGGFQLLGVFQHQAHHRSLHLFGGRQRAAQSFA